ncbi:MAG: GNAT family N-acetyltransferase [Desulfatibacillum sp.]|nr:GNAT family N-acetyltransferase [Desulfatibacillum sp.]
MTTPPHSFEVRRMTREELDTAVLWAKKEGWNPGVHDAECFYRTDPQGYFAGVLDGQLVSSISAVSYGEGFGFIGFYIVKPEYRGQGFGLAVWKAAMEYLGDRNIGLDGVLAEEKTYEKSGFKTVYHNIRFEGVGGGFRPDSVEPLESFSFDDILEYDSRFFPVPREAFLKGWLAMPNCFAYGVRENGSLGGYGVIRSCSSGFKIGPLFARDGNMAEDLFRALISHTPNGPVFLDVPESNREAVNMAKKHRMVKSFETVRMYTKEAPDMSLSGIFGVTSLELG